jgi:NAD(P)-dependent dehydrogenase (short-subunit alcohol dehydrogenase family)
MTNEGVVLITGCSSGIGYETALLFAGKGYKTYATVHALRSEGTKHLIEVARQNNLTLEVRELDVTSDESVKRAVKSIIKDEGKIDILINNAGFGFLGPLEEFSIAEIQKQFETNFYGAVRVTQEVLPGMRARKIGRILTITSINGLVSFPLYGVYSSSKFALETYMEVLRFEVRPFCVQVAIIEPGVFRTNFWINRQHPVTSEGDYSAYHSLKKFYTVLESKKALEQNGVIKTIAHPHRVAQTLHRLAECHNPPLRTIVGLDAKFLYVTRKLLPERLWFWLLSIAYNW